MSQIKGFALSIILVVALFVISAISAGIIADVMGIWKKPIIGAFAAFCVVMCGYITAPSYKREAAIIWFIVGAITAWFLSGDSFYPEDHEHEYQLTIIPIISTYLSGIFALLVCLVWHKQRDKS